jgi:hypothetical protein
MVIGLTTDFIVENGNLAVEASGLDIKEGSVKNREIFKTFGVHAHRPSSSWSLGGHMINHVYTIDGRKFHNIYNMLHLVSLPVLARGNRFVFTNRHGNLGFPSQSWDRRSPHTYQACAYGVEVFTFTSQFPE